MLKTRYLTKKMVSWSPQRNFYNTKPTIPNFTSWTDSQKYTENFKNLTDQYNMDSLIETGSNQAIKALEQIENKTRDLDKNKISTTVTFNAGILQISFTSSKSNEEK